MNCVLIDEATGAIVNMIVADAAIDQPPKGFVLKQMPADQPVDQRYEYKGKDAQNRDKFDPGAALKAEQEEAAKNPPPPNRGKPGK